MINLSATKRQVVRKGLNKLRDQGLLPAVVYGHGVEPTSISIDAIAFDKVWRQVGESSLFDLSIDQTAPVKVLVQDIQFHPTKQIITHVDLRQVKMDEKITAEIPLKYVGEPRAVKELGGVLIKNANEVKVECLPADLIREIEVDISGLVDFEKGFAVKDLVLPKGIKVLSQPDELLAIVAAPRTEAELESIKGEVKEDVSQVEKVENKKPAEDQAEAK